MYVRLKPVKRIHSTSLAMEASRWMGLSDIMKFLRSSALGPAPTRSGANWTFLMMSRAVSLFPTVTETRQQDIVTRLGGDQTAQTGRRGGGGAEGGVE